MPNYPGRSPPRPAESHQPRHNRNLGIICEVTLHSQDGVVLAEPFQLAAFGLGQVPVGVSIHGAG